MDLVDLHTELPAEGILGAYTRFAPGVKIHVAEGAQVLDAEGRPVGRVLGAHASQDGAALHVHAKVDADALHLGGG